MSGAWIDEGRAEIAQALAAGELALALDLRSFIARAKECEECGSAYVPAPRTAQRARFCSRECRKEEQRALRYSTRHDPEPVIQRVAEIIQRDPELEAWQLRERTGASDQEIWEARRRARIPEPRWLSRRDADIGFLRATRRAG